MTVESLLGAQHGQLSDAARLAAATRPLDVIAQPMYPWEARYFPWRIAAEQISVQMPFPIPVAGPSSALAELSPVFAPQSQLRLCWASAHPQLGSQPATEPVKHFSAAKASSSERLKSEGDRLPYLSIIRDLLDRDEVAAARALTSVALAALPAVPELVRISQIVAPPRSTKRPVRDVERHSEYSWLLTHANSYRGKWVALIGNELIDSSASLKDLLDSLKALGRQTEALIHRVD